MGIIMCMCVCLCVCVCAQGSSRGSITQHLGYGGVSRCGELWEKSKFLGAPYFLPQALERMQLASQG